MIIEINSEMVKSGIFTLCEGDVIHELSETANILIDGNYIGKEIKTITDTLIHGLLLELSEDLPVGLNLSHVKSIMRINENGNPIKVDWKPSGFLGPYYPNEDNPIFNILKSKYGDSPMWNKTIFHLGSIICHYIKQYGKPDHKHPKFKKRVLQIASKHKVGFRHLSKEIKNEERDFYYSSEEDV